MRRDKGVGALARAAGLTRTVAVLVLVVGGPAGAQARRPSDPPEIVNAAVVDGSREIAFASGVWPARLYVGQQATYEIGIFLSEDMRGRLRSNPQFVPPDVRSMIAYDLPASGRLYERRVPGRIYDVHVFSRALFPLTAGAQVVPPARLTYAVPLSNSIFSREESHTLRSSAQALSVLEPPLGARPDGYLGAVGQLAVRARVDAAGARVGDPVLLTLVVSGIGNVGLFPRPALAVPWGHAVAGPERVRIDSSARLIAGDKEFEWVVTPRQSGPQAIPGIRYPYFNPYTERYEIAVTQPLGIQVRPGALVAAGAAPAASPPRLTVRRTLRGDAPLPWPARPLFWAGLLLAPVPAALTKWRRRARVAEARSPRRDLEALARSGTPDVRDVRRAARAALVARIPLVGAHTVADGAMLERTLRRSGVSVAVARDARRLFAALDEFTYAPAPPPSAGMAARAVAVLNASDREATPAGVALRGPRLRGRGHLVFAALVAGGGVLAAQSSNDGAAFTAGVAAWDAGDVTLAHQAFGELASRRPRAPDVWANLGTAAWQAGDTAGAVVGWQRALRLEPLADDVRQRLTRTPSFRDGLDGDVPPVPLNGAAALGALLWLAGWAVAARRHATRGTVALPWLVGACLTGVAALWLSERLRGPREVVATSADVLRDAPAVSARPGAALAAGETGRVIATQGTWNRLHLADGREGWLEARGLESLEVPAAR